MEEKENLQRKRPQTKRRRWPWIVLAFIILLIIVLVGTAYIQVRKATEATYEPVQTAGPGQEPEEAQAPTDPRTGEPLSVLLLGIDTGEYGRVEQGRSDTMILLTANPNESSAVMMSIPRDSYVEIPGYGMDKINHAYAFGGPSLSIQTVQNLFQIPVDYYVSVDMHGLQQIIDTIGGITITPLLTFNQGGYSFVEGQPTEMDGAMVLEYSRMRKNDPQGDYGRQARQRQVIVALIDELVSLDTILNYPELLNLLEQHFRTNFEFNDMVQVFMNYSGTAQIIHQDQLRGSGQMINGVYYEIIPDEEVQRAQELLQEHLEITD